MCYSSQGSYIFKKVAKMGQIREHGRRMAFCGKKSSEIFEGILPLEHTCKAVLLTVIEQRCAH